MILSGPLQRSWNHLLDCQLAVNRASSNTTRDPSTPLMVLLGAVGCLPDWNSILCSSNYARNLGTAHFIRTANDGSMGSSRMKVRFLLENPGSTPGAVHFYN